MVSNEDVAKAFAAKKQKMKGNHMFIEGGVCYSYGHHFPMAKWIGGNEVLVNGDKNSPTTNRHMRHLLYAMRDYEAVFCSTSELKCAIDNPSAPIIITRYVEPKYLSHALEILRTVCKDNGMKKFPMKKLKNYLSGKTLVDSL